MKDSCPFCDVTPDRIAFSDQFIVALWDAFPVSPGHLLIVPRRHAAIWEDLSEAERNAVWRSIDRGIEIIMSQHAPDGFNVGFNHSEAAGQTVFHFHLHVIPAIPATSPIHVVAFDM